MGAREDLLDAASALTRRGIVPFSPAELIAEAQAHGSRYPDTTLRSFVVGPMCVNSPNHHAVQYADLFRVGHGLYRLAEGSGNGGERAGSHPDQPAGVVADAPAESMPAASDAMSEWWWEGNVQAAVVHHLATRGWRIRRVADTSSRERGVDVEAIRGDERLLVEVKGYPSATYVRGPKEGTRKTGAVPLQARSYFGGALLTGMLLRADHPLARVALAFPQVETYATLCGRTHGPLSLAGVELWLVREDGEVRRVTEDPLA